MIAFAVFHGGLEEGNALWVLHVDAETNQFLLCGPQGFYWKSITMCVLARVHTPDNPTIVADMADLQAGNARLALPGKGF